MKKSYVRVSWIKPQFVDGVIEREDGNFVYIKCRNGRIVRTDKRNPAFRIRPLGGGEGEGR